MVEGATRITYREWHDRTLRVAGGLRDLGIGPGDHVVTVLANHIETTLVYWAGFIGVVCFGLI